MIRSVNYTIAKAHEIIRVDRHAVEMHAVEMHFEN